MNAPDGLERHAVGGGAETRGERHAGVLLEFDFLPLHRAAVRRGEAQVALHGDDAGAGPGHGAGAAEDVDVVAGRLLDDLQ